MIAMGRARARGRGRGRPPQLEEQHREEAARAPGAWGGSTNPPQPPMPPQDHDNYPPIGAGRGLNLTPQSGDYPPRGRGRIAYDEARGAQGGYFGTQSLGRGIWRQNSRQMPDAGVGRGK